MSESRGWASQAHPLSLWDVQGHDLNAGLVQVAMATVNLSVQWLCHV